MSFLVLLVLLGARAQAFPPHMECWPVSKRVAAHLERTGPDDGGLVVVVEESVCDASGEGRHVAPDIAATLEGEVRAIDEALSRPPTPISRGGGRVRVVAGDAAFLDRRVDVQPTACPHLDSEGWTVGAATCCVLHQIGEATFAPCQATPVVGMPWVPKASPIEVADFPLLDALVVLAGVEGREPLAFFFLSSPGEPEGRPDRRVVFDVLSVPQAPPTFDDGFREAAAVRGVNTMRHRR